MSKYFNLDLGNKSNAEVRSEGGTLSAKLAASSFFAAVSTVNLTAAIAALKNADDNLGTGTGSTALDHQKRADVDYEFTTLVGVIDAMIANPAITADLKELMKDDTGLVKRSTGARGKQVFGFLQTSSTTPAFLLAQGIEGGGGIHQWKITKDVTTFTGYELLDPTEHARIELTSVLHTTKYAAMHRTCKKGIWSDWEGPMLFTTL